MNKIKSLLGRGASVAALVATGLCVQGACAQAGIFDLPGFLDPGAVSLGLEPEIGVSQNVGANLTLKPRVGINDLMNIELIGGTGVGDRRFRIGGILDLEWFPDVNSQPGIASPVTLMYTNLKGQDEIMVTVMPLFYKTFNGSDELKYTPYIGLPFGWTARESMLRGYTQVGLGTMIQAAAIERVKFVVEAGFNLHQSYSYISGGAVFYFSSPRGFGGKNSGDGAPVRPPEPPAPASQGAP